MKQFTFIQARVLLFILPFVSFTTEAKTKIVFGTDYTSELQSDFDSGVKWVGLLQNNLSIHFPHRSSREGSEITIKLLTVHSTSENRLANDQQTFSNIEGPDLLLSPFLMGYTYHFNDNRLFAGLRNVNEDYFTTEYTSLFTQSSAGIHPTLSANFELTDYPQTGLALFLEMNISPCLRFRTSVYNGVTGTFYGKKDHPFGFDYQNNGVFIMQDMLLSKANFRYNFGMMAYFSGEKLNRGGVVWGVVEKPVLITDHMEIGVVFDASYSFMSAPQCSSYMSLGFVADGLIGEKGKSIIASRLFYAGIREQKEFDLELNWLYQINSRLQIQPALHVIHTDKLHPVMLCRGIFTF